MKRPLEKSTMQRRFATGRQTQNFVQKDLNLKGATTAKIIPHIGMAKGRKSDQDVDRMSENIVPLGGEIGSARSV